MTNRNMVKGEDDAAGRGMPRPNRAPPQPMPAPESDPSATTLQEPLDSPQVKPMIRQRQTKGLTAPR